MRFGLAGGDFNLFQRGVGAAIADIVQRRAVEHRGFLRDHADLAAQAFLRHVAHILPVDPHRAFFTVVQPQEQRHER